MQNIKNYWSGDRPPCVVGAIRNPAYRQLAPAQMADGAVESLRGWDESRANLPPMFFPDFGPPTMAKSWGGEVVRQDNGEFFIKPVARTVDEALEIQPRENPDARLALDIFREVCGRLGRTDILFRTLDLQGVLNTAAMVVKQEELLIAMHAEPDKAHAFLGRVCDDCIRFVRELLAEVGRVHGNIWPYFWLPSEFGVSITEDLMPLLSAELYVEFGMPYLKRVADEFGGVFIHCCGDFARHLGPLAESGIRILGFDFHHPFTTFRQIQEHFDGIVLTPNMYGARAPEYATGADFLRSILEERSGKNAIWMPACDELPQDISRVITKHGGSLDGFRE